MNTKTTLLACALTMPAVAAFGQILFEDFEGTPTIPSSWTVFSVDADTGNSWFEDSFSGDNFAEVNAFNDTAAANDWLISPLVSIPTTSVNPFLTFQNTKNFDDSGVPEPLSVLWSTSYSGSGDPTGDFTEFTGVNYSSGSFNEVSSGNIDLSGFVGQDIYIGFQYESSGTGAGSSALFQLDDVSVVPEPEFYGALVGLLAIGFAVIRRRRRS